VLLILISSQHALTHTWAAYTHNVRPAVSAAATTAAVYQWCNSPATWCPF